MFTEAPPVQEAPEDDVQIKLEAMAQMIADLQSSLGKKMTPPEAEAQPVATGV